MRGDGVTVVEGRKGEMVSVGEIVATVLGRLGRALSGVRVLVTAGGTREPIDSVRFVGNRSSGKMGLAVAREAARMGAEVTVVAANVERVEPGVRWIPVETFGELCEEVSRQAAEADALVMAAAVSDFTPAEPVREKIRRKELLTIEFKATEDILKGVRDKNPDLFMVGFAATHGDPVGDAREKLRSKGVDLVIGNDISQPGIGFGSDENEVYVVGWKEERFVPQAGKEEVARAILDVLVHEMNEEKRR
ncbi:MAG: phosphopantothenoylcysteine decarboxylase [Rubrobacteraceae bacterium]